MAEAVLAPGDEFWKVAQAPRRLRNAVISSVFGLVIVLIGMFGIRSSSATLRCAVTAVGVVALFRGLQELGRIRIGPEFALGVWLALFWLVVVVLVAIFADLLPIDSYRKTELVSLRARPRLSFDEPLGRDANGASLLSRSIFAARVSLIVAFLSVSLGLTIGSLLGLVAATSASGSMCWSTCTPIPRWPSRRSSSCSPWSQCSRPACGPSALGWPSCRYRRTRE